jgi:hypothetical protein
MQKWTSLVAALALAMLGGAGVAAAQDGSASSPSAWWARIGEVDGGVGCAAQVAWLRATDVERRDEEQGTTEQLDEVATGAELAREQERLSGAAPQTEQKWATYSSWTVAGGNSEEVVIYATDIARAGPADAAGHEIDDAKTVDTRQAAYRMVLDNGEWRLADRHVFEERRHAFDDQLGTTVLQQYQQLIDRLIQAYNARDVDGLRSVLDGPALEQYRAELQQLVDQQDDRTAQFGGRLGLIDADPSGALMAFIGTRTSAEEGQPTTLVHRLEVVDGQWKIVDEMEATARRESDGTEHLAGCG